MLLDRCNTKEFLVLIPGVVLRKPYMERLGPDLERVHPLEAAVLDTSVVVVHVP